MARQHPSGRQVRAAIDAHLGTDVAQQRVVHHHCNTHVYVTTDNGEKVVIRICDGPYWTESHAIMAWKFQRERIWSGLTFSD